MIKKIILSGYMGSGKTTLGRLLGLKTGVESVDLDHLIEKKSGISIADIFEKNGEIYFRKLEHSTLRELLQSAEPIILSLGGGTPCYSGNNQLIKQSGAVNFYLKASISTLCMRLSQDQATRPLIKGLSEKELQEFVAKHLFERNPYYNEADYVIETDGKSPVEISEEILNLV